MMCKTVAGKYYKFQFGRATLNIEKTMQKIEDVPNNGKLVIFGAGLQSLPLFYYLKDANVDIACFCDNDNTKTGKKYCGKPIISKDVLLAGKEEYYMLIGADCYADEITNGLCEIGFPSEHIVSVREHQMQEIVLPMETLDDVSGMEEYRFETKCASSNEPLITLFMFCYDAPGYYVRRAIQSVLSQTFELFELLIVDNASNAENKAVIAEFKSLDNRIKVLRLNKNTHHSEDANTLVKEWLSKEIAGKYFCKLDSDDYLAPTFLERVYCAADNNNADLVAANLLWYSESCYSGLRWSGTLNYDEIVLSGSADIADAIMDNIMQFSSKQAKLFRTRKLLAFHLFETSIPDSIIGAVPKLNKAVILKDLLYFYTVRAGSISTTPNITNNVTRSNYGIVKKVYDGFIAALTQCVCLTDKNLYIVRQNFMNHIKQSVIPHIVTAKDKHAVCQNIDVILKDLVNIEVLRDFPEYDDVIAKLQSVLREAGDSPYA